jgi:hypothetical protein
MLHSIIHWPAEARPDLWPMALDQAIYLWNNMPQRSTRMAPTELFTETKFSNYNHLQRAHVWGCPVYVLDPMLQDGKKLPKWRPRARRGFYVGVSQRNSTNIGRVLNLQTGHISNQFQCVYDNHFTTVSCPGGNPFEAASFNVTSWNHILESGYERHVNIEVDDRGRPIVLRALDDNWLTGPERQLRALIRRQQTERRMEQLRADGQARAQREPRLLPEADPPPPRLQREPEQQLQRELLPNPEPTR